jgi:hypothetical protein
MTEFIGQPAAEHSTRDPWPDGFEAPPELVKLKAAAEKLGWEARLGYSRAYEKRGRGKVGGSGDARWVRRHFVGLQVRRPGMVRYPWNRVVMGQDTEPEDAPWTRTSVQVDGLPSGILALRKRIKEGP